MRHPWGTAAVGFLFFVILSAVLTLLTHRSFYGGLFGAYAVAVGVGPGSGDGGKGRFRAIRAQSVGRSAVPRGLDDARFAVAGYRPAAALIYRSCPNPSPSFPPARSSTSPAWRDWESHRKKSSATGISFAIS